MVRAVSIAATIASSPLLPRGPPARASACSIAVHVRTPNATGTPVRLADVADIRLGPQMRRGIAELNGEGEVVGGVIVMRFGENARKTIQGVKARIAELERSLPEGVEIVETYDRSQLIQRAVDNLGLSARAYHRVLKVARTIADLAGADEIRRAHAAEAVLYRGMDRRVA